MKAASASNNNMPISVRPSQEARKQLAQIAKELRKSDAQVITDFLTDALEMLETGRLAVPRTVNMIHVLRAHNATLEARTEGERAQNSDRREVTFYGEDGVNAGNTTGVCANNEETQLTVPESFAGKVDFAVRVCGDSMQPVIENGEIALFRATQVAADGRIVCAMVEGQMMLKLFKMRNGGPAHLVSLNPKYAPIVCTSETRIQGIYEGNLPATYVKEQRAEKKRKSRRLLEMEGPAPF